ncbi:YkvA family protein [Paenibacillaceae bacterium WGS1546]|uniref:YkvA family protein n=1 Tax=Cohnella sp. WGS1546 TaxID=3366810 RepID=UPI00372D5E3C
MKGKVFGKLKNNARKLKQELYVLYLAYRDSRVPRYAKLVAACVVAYAFSPIDLIPDFIPILGYVDDLLLVPLGIILAIKLIPSRVLEDCRERAEEIMERGNPPNYVMAGIIMVIWIAVAAWIGSVVWRLLLP